MMAKMPAATMRTMTMMPPKFMAVATKKARVKATPAVMNQPPMTVSTPVMRKTALSLLQARSESEEPMATMKVTKVVESGNLSVVPSAIKREATQRLTEARQRS